MENSDAQQDKEPDLKNDSIEKQSGAQLKQTANSQNKDDENGNMALLLEQEGIGIEFPRKGEVRDGVIASITPGQILVSIGAKSEGVIGGREFDLIPEEELDGLVPGQTIPVYIINPEDQRGNLLLSYIRAREAVNWRSAEELLASKEIYHSTIIGYNKGGLIVPMFGLRGFVPASQVSLSRRASVTGDTPEERWGEMVEEEIGVCVIEVDRDRRRLILSERAASSETRDTLKDRVISELNEGEVRTGRITSMAAFGAFVNISGADGLVHLSEISWDRIKHPSDVLELGQDVEVKVISIDREKRRIGLSIRQLLKDPWAERVSQYKEGQLVEATITRLTKFGAFARLQEDLEGLIHISEISERRIEHPKEILHEDDVVTLRIIKVDPENHRIGLSIRRVDSMAFADMDWQTLLEEDIVESEEESEVLEDISDKADSPPEESRQADVQPEESQTIDDSPEDNQQADVQLEENQPKSDSPEENLPDADQET